MAAVYNKVPFERNGVRRGILCEGPQGPSALVAVYNILVIRHTSFYGKEGPIHEDAAKSLIRGTLRIALRNLEGRSSAVSKPLQKKLSAAIDGLPAPAAGFDVRPLLGDALSFEVNHPYMLFSYLGIQLMHGWVADPDEASMYEAIKDCSRADLAERYRASLAARGLEEESAGDDDMALVQGLLDASARQLTSYGLASLVAKIDDEDFAVVFCHNRFNVVHKHDGELFVLETDGEVRRRFPQVMWRLFDGEVQEENCIYLTEQFTPVKGQPNIVKGIEWIQKKLARKKKAAETIGTASSNVGSPTHGSDEEVCSNVGPKPVTKSQ